MMTSPDRRKRTPLFCPAAYEFASRVASELGRARSASFTDGPVLRDRAPPMTTSWRGHVWHSPTTGMPLAEPADNAERLGRCPSLRRRRTSADVEIRLGLESTLGAGCGPQKP